jgi:DNA-binding transcriptional regulator GbsR (MarR family)
MYKYKKVKREYQRQEKVRLGWEILYNLCQTMNSKKIKNNLEMLKDYESELNSQLCQNGIRQHKAIHIFKQEANYMRRKLYIDYGITKLYMIATERC